MNKTVKISLIVLGSALLIGGGIFVYYEFFEKPTGKGEVSDATKKNTIKIVK